jgi:hypothetical protein
MSALLRFLQDYEIPLYILLGIVGIGYIRKMAISWREWRIAMFGLEKDVAQRRFSSSLTIVILLLLMSMTIFTLVSFIAPTFPGVSTLNTPTIDLLATSIGTINPLETPGIGTTIAASTGTGCVPDQLEWTYPLAGDKVSGWVELKGTVNIPNLGYYKFEFSQPGSSTWIAISAGNKVVIDETLGGVWNTEQLTPGEYSLRLVAFDSSNENTLGTCVIPVQVVAPQ